MPRKFQLHPVPHLLALATSLALHGAAAAAPAPAACTPGLAGCPRKTDDFALCKPNALLSIYTPGLPTSGTRESATTDFTAQRFQSKDTSRYVLQGDARIQRLDQLLQADQLTYWTETTAYLAEGNVRYQDRGMLLSADKAQGTTDPNASTLDNVQYQLLQGRGNGAATQAKLIDADHAAMTAVSYSTCDPGDRQWEITAKDLALDQAEGIGRGHDVTMRYRGTPIFWLPYARFPLDDRRQSGFLYPSIAVSNNSGFDYSQPYYLNLAPNYDATLYPRIVGQRGFMFGAEFRYLQEHNKGEIQFNWLPNDRKSDKDRGYFHFEDYATLSQNWSFAANISHVSDDRYFEDFGNSLSSVATSLLPSSAYLNGHGTWWTASFGADRYQITDPTLDDQFEPYRRLPRATFEADHALGSLLRGGVRSEFVSFHKPGALDGERLDAYPYLSLPLEGNAWFLRPEVGVRYTSYHLDREIDGSPTRNTPIVSIDSGLVFERDVQWFGSKFLQTLEPRAYYLRVPYRDQSGLPVFDTQPINFDFAQLFTTNRFAGADRQVDANNLTLALTSRLLETETGNERLSASLGQIRYFDDQRVQLPGVAPTDYDGSAYVGELDLHINERWRVRLADQWNPNGDRTDLATASLQHRFGDRGLLNLAYRYRRDFLEQTDISALLPLNEAWRLIGRWNWSLRDRKTLESFLGIEHDSCCVAWRLLARHYVRNAEGKANNALYFELEFKGMGAIGQKTDDFLRRAILGYQQ
ncbi:MAG: LPS assembly protein LptD [Tahibacter sp.]